VTAFHRLNLVHLRSEFVLLYFPVGQTIYLTQQKDVYRDLLFLFVLDFV